MNKIKTIVLFAALCVTASAGTLTDSANVFGPRGSEVSNALSSLPVSIETMVQTPPEGIKAYADRKAEESGNHSFYAVITTQPRAWRISMYPVGIASSEEVRMAGDRMTARFRKGEFAAGAITLARDLDRLANPPAPIQRQVQRPQPTYKHEESHVVLWVVLGTGMVLAIIFTAVLVNKSNDRKEKERLAKAEREAAERVTPIPTSRPAASEEQQAKAQRFYDSYTPAQRETIIRDNHYHHYSQGASTDPLLFWMMLNATQPHYIYNSPAPAPSSDYTPRYSSPSSSSDSSSSSSDSSGSSSSSSSSYDSGSSSSSFDSGSSSSSSSDSSGGGGSW